MRRFISSHRGFSTVELAVVVVIIAILGGFAVPKFLNSVERSKAQEAFNYLSTLQDAQQRYFAQEGSYAARRQDLDVELPALEYFETNGFEALDAKTLETRWSMTLTRKNASAGFGDYTVVFNQNGFDGETSTIARYPDINPAEPRGRK